MPPAPSRREFLRAAVPVLALSAGCLGSPGDATTTAWSGDPTTTRETTARSTSSITNATAEQRALSAETEYVRSRLRNASCLDEWGIGEYTMDAKATAVDRTAEGVVVEVQRPYSWEKDGSVVDAGTYPRYRVTADRPERLSGDSVDPCW